MLHEAAARSATLVDAAQARHHGQQAVDAYRATGDSAGELRASAELARAFTHDGKLTDAINLLVPLTADPSRDNPEAAFALAELARAYMLSDQGPAAVATADRAMAALGTTRNPRVVVEALASKASAIWTRTTESEALLRGAIAIADAEGLTEPGLRARNNLVSGLMYSVSATETLRILDDGTDTGRRLGIDGWLVQLLTVSAIMRLQTGDWARCDDHLAELESLNPDTTQAAAMHGMRAVDAGLPWRCRGRGGRDRRGQSVGRAIRERAPAGCPGRFQCRSAPCLPAIPGGPAVSPLRGEATPRRSGRA